VAAGHHQQVLVPGGEQPAAALVQQGQENHVQVDELCAMCEFAGVHGLACMCVCMCVCHAACVSTCQ